MEEHRGLGSNTLQGAFYFFSPLKTASAYSSIPSSSPSKERRIKEVRFGEV
jgi:hypothetical protein